MSDKNCLKRKNLYRDLVVTTSWDDGQKADFKIAKMLTKYNLKGTFYITKPYYRDPLEKQDIVEMDNDHEIGAHTLTHVDLSNIPISDAKREIEGSKAYIEAIIGHQIEMFCYPYGRYNEEIMKIVEDAGFIGARTCNSSNLGLSSDLYEWQVTLYASNASLRTTFKVFL